MLPGISDGHLSVRYDPVIHRFARGRQWAFGLPGTCKFYASLALDHGIQPVPASMQGPVFLTHTMSLSAQYCARE
jgi:hypothetical protein